MEWWVWCIIAYTIGCSVFCGISGYRKRDAFDTMMCAAFWPLIVSFLIVIAPFFGVYILGEHIADQKIERNLMIIRIKSLFRKLDLDED